MSTPTTPKPAVHDLRARPLLQQVIYADTDFNGTMESAEQTAHLAMEHLAAAGLTVTAGPAAATFRGCTIEEWARQAKDFQATAHRTLSSNTSLREQLATAADHRAAEADEREDLKAQVEELSATIHANGEAITALQELTSALEAHHLAYVAYTSKEDRLSKNLVVASNRLDAARAAFGPEEDDPWSTDGANVSGAVEAAR